MNASNYPTLHVQLLPHPPGSYFSSLTRSQHCWLYGADERPICVDHLIIETQGTVKFSSQCDYGHPAIQGSRVPSGRNIQGHRLYDGERPHTHDDIRNENYMIFESILNPGYVQRCTNVSIL